MSTLVYEKPESLYDRKTHYCPGCGHGVAHRLIAETIDELDIRHKTIGIAPVGCSVLAYNYLNIDMVEVAHGRAPAVATGMKRVKPDHIIFAYQGDGDLASIGCAEIMHAAHRGEDITVIFVNNAIYGMTGGQMAPTTMVGQIASTCPNGRDPLKEGYPMQMAEILSIMPGATYIERCAITDPANIRKTKKAIKHAFQRQLDGENGFNMVEILSPCPTYWRMSPVDAKKHITEQMTKTFPLGKLKG
ncbi:MAG: 2-oxoglutarate oxidoreductase [Phycisphaerae bacterium]|nr:2-oxoglutarate oxidoreductase [Phycisphaerae bacterium]